VTAVPDAGYHFTGWSDGVDTPERRDTGVTEDAEVTANFELNTYVVSYAATAGGSIEGSATQTVAHGSDAEAVVAVPASGYRFASWSDGVTTAERHDTGITGDLSVTARFEVALGKPGGVSYGPTSDGRTTINWTKAPGATGYQIYVNGRLVATVGPDTTSYTFSQLLGPNAKVSVKALGAGGTESETVAGTYSAKQVGKIGKIRFTGYSTTLSPSAKRELRRMADLIKAQGFKTVVIEGHTSTRLFRSEAYHKRLSQERAEVAKKYLAAELAKRGVSAKIIAKGYGKSRPIASNLTWRGRAENRRAEVFVK
jgi:outer membrane protein OmpA-like peptidoglycan-associated protein